ncbi:hypothetical protein DFH08DRAFT_827696 [Mycena albidolilacea]|uniref:Uncharacterized protein n=1 Tax=Mycena albidolilacea TaxID=1033008 RepID=A0AAD6YY94_9AGAR|nr:hypothetical protein DFH08DRAFT_827696 [Mycena albidolilacea]
MTHILLQDTDYDCINAVREGIAKRTPGWPRLQTGLLCPDGNTLHKRVWVKAPVSQGLERAMKVSELEVDLWIDAGRGGFEGTNNAALTSIRIDRFPFDEPRDLKHSYSIVVADQDQHGLFLYPENALVNKLEPDLKQAWRGNILVFKHGTKPTKAIVNITDSDVTFVEAILKCKLYANGGRDRFFATAELRRSMLLYLPLIPLFNYGRASRFTRGDVMSLARERVEHYTSPFFPSDLLPTLFFYQLEDHSAWIVGSVALAALSFSCDLPVPNNLNVITSASTEDAWITSMCDCMGYTLRSVPCGGFYAKLAQSRLIFTHKDVQVGGLPLKSIALLKRSDIVAQEDYRHGLPGADVFELFLRARSTLMANAVSAQELISTYVELTSNCQGVSGYTPAFTRPLDVSFIEWTSPFPDAIELLDSTETLGRPCGLACPGRTRVSTNIAGIGHWVWGGVSNFEWEEDANLIAMRKSDITYKSGDFCRNPHCGVRGVAPDSAERAIKLRPLAFSFDNDDTASNSHAKVRFFAITFRTDWIERTPSPVLTSILLWACGSYFEWDGEDLVLDHRNMPNLATNAKGTFLDTRLSLQLVCHEWNGLIMYCGTFWSSYTIGPFKSRTEFHKWSRRMTAVPSHIVIALPSVRTRTAGPSRGTASVSDDYVSVQDIIPLLRRQGGSCATLFIAAPDAPSLATLVEGIQDISFSAVSHLALVVCDMRDKSRTALRTKAMDNQPTLGGIPSPRCNPYMLRLKGVGLSWMNTTRIHYGNISTLSLHFLGSEAAPLAHELHSLLAHAAALERMSIHRVHVTGSYMPKSKIIMNSLKFLQYGPGGSETLGLLMANICAPAYHTREAGDLPLGVCCGARPLRAPPGLARPAVSTLDIAFASLQFLYGLHDNDVLPGLRALAHHETWFELLHNLAKWRPDLSRLVLYQPEEFIGIPIEMTPNETAVMLGLIDRLEYVSVLPKTWYT